MSQDNTLPSYASISDALRRINALSEASEAHALLCALFTVGADVRIQAWVDSLMASPIDPNDAMAKPALKVLSEMYQATKTQFESGDLSFDLLLPDDEEPFHKRIDALAMWAQGFLSGLGLMEINLNDGSEAVGEAINDLIDVSRLQYDDEVTGEAVEESAYMELAEYTKVAVLLIQSEFGLTGESSSEETKH
ncbi:UPF0149 family protein [Fangia hongkongensis]|uniref:UPF0149 family protein n=1 Tax=Fangia hongkongensis TaxID=270495 RepID=UPI0003615CAB|nr:UPF0149 family protein [Fangia hongkongensis]MBK2124637.1 UPF0149 family protein [Fangia hongkongensis]